MRELGLTYAELARKIGEKPQTINNWKRRGNIPADKAPVVAEVLGVTTDWLMSGRGTRKPAPAVPAGAAPIPEVDVRAGAGGGGEAPIRYEPGPEGRIVESEELRGTWYLPETYLRAELHVTPSHCRIIEIRGDSMMRPDGGGLHPGDRVLVDLGDRGPSPPGIFALWDGFGVVVKRIEPMLAHDPPRIRVISDNPAHGAYELAPEEVHVIGRVVWYARRI